MTGTATGADGKGNGDGDDDQLIYRGRVVTLWVKTIRLKDGRPARREIVDHADGAAVVAVDDDGNVVLVRQHRPAVGIDLLELPAGLVDEGEDPATCAARELEEETGLRAGRLTPLARFYASPGFANETLHIFVATDLEPTTARLEDDEDLEVVRLPLSDALDHLLTTETSDAKTLTGLLAYARHPHPKF